MERRSKQREMNEGTNKSVKEDDKSSDTPPTNFPQVFFKDRGFFLRFLGEGRGQIPKKCNRKHKKEARENKEKRNDFPQVFTKDFS